MFLFRVGSSRVLPEIVSVAVKVHILQRIYIYGVAPLSMDSILVDVLVVVDDADDGAVLFLVSEWQGDTT
jgi:hypothetical protein